MLELVCTTAAAWLGAFGAAGTPPATHEVGQAAGAAAAAATGTRAWLAVALPGINACFNAASTCLLLAGYIAIRRRQVRAHLVCMLAALTSSALFLLGYLTRMALTGTHRFPAWEPWRSVYLVLLFSHMVLAVALLPMILRTLQHAARQRFDAHRRLARWTWPVWMYVSVTGVVVYWMLYHLVPAHLAAA